MPDGDWYCPDCAPRPEDKCVLCLASTAANDPNSVLICDECDGDAHLECTGLAAVPGAEEYSCAGGPLAAFEYAAAVGPYLRGRPVGGWLPPMVLVA